MVKSSGPMTEPCGTPVEMGVRTGLWLPILDKLTAAGKIGLHPGKWSASECIAVFESVSNAVL